MLGTTLPTKVIAQPATPAIPVPKAKAMESMRRTGTPTQALIARFWVVARSLRPKRVRKKSAKSSPTIAAASAMMNMRL